MWSCRYRGLAPSWCLVAGLCIDPTDEEASIMDSEQQEIERLNEELKRRQFHPRLPSRAGDVLNQLMAKRGYNQRQANSARERAWAEAAGEKIAQQSKAVRLSRGVLTVIVVNSVVMQELIFQQATLTKRMNEADPDLQVKSLRFRVGAI